MISLSSPIQKKIRIFFKPLGGAICALYKNGGQIGGKREPLKNLQRLCDS